jgi:tRNA-dihydrouridine synthase B
MMAEAAVYNVERGAQIIDINMGCPAKKVCNKWAGSALMQDEALAVEIAAGRGRGLRAAQRARHAEDAHRLVPAAQERRGAGAPVRIRGHPDAHGARPHARAGLQGPGRVRHHRRREGGGAVPVVANGDITSPEKARECWPTPGPTPS